MGLMAKAPMMAQVHMIMFSMLFLVGGWLSLMQLSVFFVEFYRIRIHF